MRNAHGSSTEVTSTGVTKGLAYAGEGLGVVGKVGYLRYQAKCSQKGLWGMSHTSMDSSSVWGGRLAGWEAEV